MPGGPTVEKQSVTCRVRGEKFEVFLGGEGVLWRWVTQEDRMKSRRVANLHIGQNVVTSSGHAAMQFLTAYGVASDVRDKWIQLSKRKRR